MVWITKKEYNSRLNNAQKIFKQSPGLDVIEFIPGKCITREGYERSIQYVQMILMDFPPVSLMTHSDFEDAVSELVKHFYLLS